MTPEEMVTCSLSAIGACRPTAILARREFPPRLDAPSSDGCGSGRLRAGLNDAGWRVHRGNYAVFLEQVDPITTSVGAWRAGPEDEIFVRPIHFTHHLLGLTPVWCEGSVRSLPAPRDGRPDLHHR